jgi:hypothetical protein
VRRTSARLLFMAELFGLAWALGLAGYTVLLFVSLEFRATFSDVMILLLIPVMLGIVFGGRILYGSRIDMVPVLEPKHRIVTGASTALSCAMVVFATWRAIKSPLNAWDAWAIWAFKGRMLATGRLHFAYFHSPVTIFSHPDYPLNLPAAESVIFHTAGSHGPGFAAMLGPICFASLLLMFFAGLSRLYGSATASLVTASLSVMPRMSLYAASGLADVPLAMYAGGASLYLMLWWRFRRRIDLVVLGLLAGSAAWTKKEGTTVAFLLLAVLAASELVRQRASAREKTTNVLLTALGVAAVSVPWFLFLLAVHPLGSDVLPLTVSTFVANIHRAPTIFKFFGNQMIAIHNWGLLWAALVGALAFRFRALSKAAYSLLILLLAQLLIYAQAYVFSSWRPYTLHIQSSLDRLFLQVTPLVLLVLVEVLCGDTKPLRQASQVADTASVA